MHFDKLLLFQKLLEKGIKPTGPTSIDFEATVVSILHEKIREEVDLHLVAPETFAVVDRFAKNFKSEMKKLYTRKYYKPQRMIPLIKGEFKTTIMRVRPDGEIKSSPRKKALSPSLAPSGAGSSKRGPTPRPYLEKELRSQQREAASIAEGRDANALYHAAYSKASTDVRFVMRRMKEIEGLATEIKAWYLKERKEKRMYFNQCTRAAEQVKQVKQLLHRKFRGLLK